MPLEDALQARQTSIDHFDRYVEFLVPPDARDADRDPGFFGSGVVDRADPARIPDAVQRTLDAGTWNVPTLSLVEHLASPETAETMIAWPEMRYMPAEVRDGWVRSKHEYAARADFQPEATARLVALRRQLLVALYEAGAPVALGSDAPQFFNVPGFSIHHEMRMMADAGLTPWQVLETGTVAAARYFDAPGEFGAIVPGAHADLILLTADPLADLANVRERAGVMVAGRWLPEAEIQARLEAIAERRAAEAEPRRDAIAPRATRRAGPAARGPPGPRARSRAAARSRTATGRRPGRGRGRSPAAHRRTHAGDRRRARARARTPARIE